MDAQYIAGTCSFAAAIERDLARNLKRMVLTMVGPPGFYKDGPDGTAVNPYVFGIHINSDMYGKPAITTTQGRLSGQQLDLASKVGALVGGQGELVLTRLAGAISACMHSTPSHAAALSTRPSRCICRLI